MVTTKDKMIAIRLKPGMIETFYYLFNVTSDNTSLSCENLLRPTGGNSESETKNREIIHTSIGGNASLLKVAALLSRR